jgi:hypothetical protein
MRVHSVAVEVMRGDEGTVLTIVQSEVSNSRSLDLSSSKKSKGIQTVYESQIS